MARASITLNKVSEPNKASAAILTANLTTALTADGAEVVWDCSDEKTLVMVQNTGSAAADFTIKAGNGIQGVNDLVINVATAATVYLQLDSGRFKHVSGEDVGKVIFAGGTSFKVGVFELA